MLRISPQQMAEMERRADEAFLRRLSHFLREELPEATAPLPDEDLLRVVRTKVAEARFAGLEAERDIGLYVVASAQLAPRFPDETPALFEIMANDAYSYEERCQALNMALEGRAE